MIDPNLIAFVWSAVVSGVAGNAAYDGIKTILGKGFDRLAYYAQEKKKSEFETALLSILETNEKIKQQLSELNENSQLIIDGKITVSGERAKNITGIDAGGKSTILKPGTIVNVSGKDSENITGVKS